MADQSASSGGETKSKFEPKVAVKLDPPKNDPITVEHLSKCDGEHEGFPTYVAVKGTVFDVSANKVYAKGGGYHVFAGKDPSRALAQSSLKPEDCTPDYEDLPDKDKQVLEDWFTFYSKRYNIVGRVVKDSSNL